MTKAITFCRYDQTYIFGTNGELHLHHDTHLHNAHTHKSPFLSTHNTESDKLAHRSRQSTSVQRDSNSPAPRQRNSPPTSTPAGSCFSPLLSPFRQPPHRPPQPKKTADMRCVRSPRSLCTDTIGSTPSLPRSTSPSKQRTLTSP